MIPDAVVVLPRLVALYCHPVECRDAFSLDSLAVVFKSAHTRGMSVVLSRRADPRDRPVLTAVFRRFQKRDPAAQAT